VPLASFADDSATSVRHSHLLIAKYGRSDGDYVCTVESRRRAYTDSCTTRLTVLRKSVKCYCCRNMSQVGGVAHGGCAIGGSG